VIERYVPNVHRFEQVVPTHVGVLHEAGHPEPWIIAMDCAPYRAAVLDDGAHWAIELTFSDFKSRGFALEDTQLQDPDRLDRLLLIMTLAMYWCVTAGRHDALSLPTVLEKSPGRERSRPLARQKTQT
jgi:hypothetical protein